MSTAERWSPGHLREIDEAECRELLAHHRVGRVAYCDDLGPVVQPVNYVLDNGSVLLRVSPYSKLAAGLRSARASFEIDEFDDGNQSGWSVLVRGDAAYVEPTEVPDDPRPVPWAEGQRTFHVRITPDDISGRRILPA
jgi:nitroimidazol reductase NimA-like FMN-containing flavoprotein (pyridoxamine 5'-phosphate oxidase superfamily)